MGSATAGSLRRLADEAVVLNPAIRDIFLIGLYTGMRLGEVVSLRWKRVDLERRILRVEETKMGKPLELPVTRQLAAIFGRLRSDSGVLHALGDKRAQPFKIRGPAATNMDA